MDIINVLTLALESVNKARGLKPGEGGYASALRWELYASLQNLLDGLAMIIADLGLRKPDTYSELGSVLREHGVLTSEDEQHVKVIARARNTVAHAYRKLDVGDLSIIERDVLPLVEEISRKLINYVTKKGLDPEQETDMEGLKAKLEPVFRKHQVMLAYLFGSRSRGKAHEKSDYDFAVLFGVGADLLSEIRMSLDVAEALNVSPDLVDVVSLNREDTGIKYRLFKEGKPVYWADRGFKNNWERVTYLQLLELKELHNIYVRRLKV